MSTEKPFTKQLDLNSQTALINILINTVDENERLTIVNQEIPSDSSQLQTIQTQIQLQKQKLESLTKSNEDIISEIENTKQVFQQKIQDAQASYETVLQEKLNLQLQKNSKYLQYQNTIGAMEAEEKILDDEIQYLQKIINDIRLKNAGSIAGTNWSSNSGRIIEESKILLQTSEAQDAYFSSILKYDAEIFCRNPSRPSQQPPKQDLPKLVENPKPIQQLVTPQIQPMIPVPQTIQSPPVPQIPEIHQNYLQNPPMVQPKVITTQPPPPPSPQIQPQPPVPQQIQQQIPMTPPPPPQPQQTSVPPPATIIHATVQQPIVKRPTVRKIVASQKPKTSE